MSFFVADMYSMMEQQQRIAGCDLSLGNYHPQNSLGNYGQLASHSYTDIESYSAVSPPGAALREDIEPICIREAPSNGVVTLESIADSPPTAGYYHGKPIEIAACSGIQEELQYELDIWLEIPHSDTYLHKFRALLELQARAC